MTMYWLLGTNGGLEEAGERLRRALAVELRLHESGYLGGDYLRGEGPTAHEIIVQRNFQDDEGYFAEEARLPNRARDREPPVS